MAIRAETIGIVAGFLAAMTAGLERGAITSLFAGVEGCLVARTGYTGEDGYEVFIPVAEAPQRGSDS